MKPISWPRAIWNYRVYLYEHKRAVFIEACLLGIPWRGIVHDWHKFLPDEFLPYLWRFYATKLPAVVEGTPQVLAIGKARRLKEHDVAHDFDRAWLKHQRRNDHHWQAWLAVEVARDGAQWIDPRSEYCQCLNCLSSSYVQIADLSSRDPILSTAGNFAATVVSITESALARIKTRIESTLMLTKRSAAVRIPREAERQLRKPKGADASRQSRTTVTEQCSALVAAKGITNFSASITSMEAARNIVQQLGAAGAFIAGLRKTIIQRDSASFATIAMRPSGTTVIVPISATMILVNDDGRVFCLKCRRAIEEPIRALEMPIGAVKEMLADWLSFSRIFGTSTWDWYWERRDDIKLAPRTRVYVESMLRRIAKERGWK
jgi:hypothetical protein